MAYSEFMPCSSQTISEKLPEIHTMEKCCFLKPIIHSQIMLLLSSLVNIRVLQVYTEAITPVIDNFRPRDNKTVSMLNSTEQ